MANKIKHAVGEGGKNDAADVAAVQALLNKVEGLNFTVDGIYTKALGEAILSFQSGFLNKPDGKIDPGGGTFNRLVLYAKLGYVLLPQSGLGYYSYSEFAKQWGTPDAIQMLQDVAAKVQSNKSVEIGIGDISFRNGAYMSPHQSHRSGKNIDVRPIRTDGAHTGVTITAAEYDQEKTRFLVETLLAHDKVKRILFNDKDIKGVTYFTGHHNHLHVETYS